MSLEELKYKESRLRECFMGKLEHLDVDGNNDYSTIKCIKTYGVLWHLTHQLVMAEEKDTLQKNDEKRGYTTSADTMNVQATGLKMAGGN